MTTHMTSRDFNQDTGGAKRAAQAGPVYITDRGRPAYVLMTFETYQQLTKQGPSIVELLSSTPGIGDVEFDAPRSGDLPRPAPLD